LLNAPLVGLVGSQDTTPFMRRNPFYPNPIPLPGGDNVNLWLPSDTENTYLLLGQSHMKSQ
jgi:hypothetical protein